MAFSIRNTSFNYSSETTFLYISASPTIQGYVHLLSTVKTTSNTTTKYFDLKLQTSENEAVCAVFFSAEKCLTVHLYSRKKSPVKIVGAQLSTSERFPSSTRSTPFPRNRRSLQLLCNSHSWNLSVTYSTL